MLRAVWNGIVLAEAPRTVRIEGNHYFPPDSVHSEYFAKSRTKTLCPWKGLAGYHNLTTERGDALDVAWYYAHPSPLARRIKNHVAFYPEVRIEGESEPRPGGGLRSRLSGRTKAS